jgi:hypothetical protein
MTGLPHSFGSLTSLTIADPAAGAEFDIRPPLRQRWLISGLRYTLTTDATVLNRLPHLRITNPTTYQYALRPAGFQAANLIFRYHWSLLAVPVSGASTEPGANTAQYCVFPRTIFLSNALYITSWTFNMQPADQLSDIQVAYESWVI